MKNDKQKTENPYAKMTIDELTTLAEQGDAEAQCRLAYYYEKGKGVEKNSIKAVEWYTKAAEQGHSIAQCNLAACYKLGKGVAKNLIKAVKLYTKSAKQGEQCAQYNLGACYYNGYGVKQDYNLPEKFAHPQRTSDTPFPSEPGR